MPRMLFPMVCRRLRLLVFLLTGLPILLLQPAARGGVIYCDEDFEGPEIFFDRNWPRSGNTAQPAPGAQSQGINLRRWSSDANYSQPKVTLASMEGSIDATRAYSGSQSYRLGPNKTLAVGSFPFRSNTGSRFWQFAIGTDPDSAAKPADTLLGIFRIDYHSSDTTSLTPDTSLILELRADGEGRAVLRCFNNSAMLGSIGGGAGEWLLVSVLAAQYVNPGSRSDSSIHWITYDPLSNSHKGPRAGARTGIHVFAENSTTEGFHSTHLRRGIELPLAWAASDSTSEIGWRFTASPEGTLYVDRFYWEARVHEMTGGGFDNERGARIKPFQYGVAPGALFSDNAVLQRDAPVPVYGTDRPGQVVTVEINGQSQQSVADAQGDWHVLLHAMPTGGPYEMVVSGSTTRHLANIMLGDVWVCSGQSNMQFTLKEATGGITEAANANYPNIRLMKVPNGPAMIPVDYCGGGWDVCDPDSAADFSAVGYFFARDMQASLGSDIAIGVISSNFGGTRAETWTRLAALEAEFGPSSPDLLPSWSGLLQHAQLYNGMIHPLVRSPIRGVAWYQGESNADRGTAYRRLLTTMVKDWRTQWRQGNFPFLIVQLPNMQDDWGGGPWPILREAQLQVFQNLPNMGLVVTIDVGTSNDVHPPNKTPVGHRLALAALGLVHGENIAYSGPLYAGHAIEGNSLRLYFTHTDGGLVDSNGGILQGFELAGGNGIYQAANATIDGDTVVLSSDAIPEPRHARYAWHNVPTTDLFNGAGLPASPFRTDAPALPNAATAWQLY